MTQRLYYAAPYETRFTAEVADTLTWEGRPAVVLDRSLFYPASGGQPADRGTVNGVQVLDVVEVETMEGPAVVHVLSEPVEGPQVDGVIDWDRRFDHMQQHTGQHILSRACEHVIGAETVSFHMGASHSTVDLRAPGLERSDILPAEARANAVIWENRAVTTQMLEPSQAEGLTTRPLPETTGPVRLVVIAGPRGREDAHFDANPCGGTHVARAGEIGLIKIVGLEHRGEQTRVEFLCGGRALRDYRTKHDTLVDLGLMMTVGINELDDAVTRLQDENRTLHRAERDLRSRLLDIESERLAETAVAQGRYRLVRKVWNDRAPGELRGLARKLAEHESVVAFLFSVNERTHFCVARGDEAAVDANALVQKICATLGGGGGGRPQVAQGSSPRADVDTIRQVLRDLEQAVVGGE